MCCATFHITVTMDSSITDIFKQRSGYGYNDSLKFVLQWSQMTFGTQI